MVIPVANAEVPGTEVRSMAPAGRDATDAVRVTHEAAEEQVLAPSTYLLVFRMVEFDS